MAEVYQYKYDKTTHEYLGKDYARLNPVETKIQGKDVYLLPPNYTMIEPPELAEHKIAIFENDGWIVKDDYRGCLICDELLNIQVVQEIGGLPEGFIFITEGQAEQIKSDYLWYVVKDGKLIKNPNYEEIKDNQHKEYIKKLAMTKYDFYKYFCRRKKISYEQLCQMVQSNDEIAAAWNLCGHVYRGDDILCKYIVQFLPDVTEEELDDLFEKHGKVINE